MRSKHSQKTVVLFALVLLLLRLPLQLNARPLSDIADSFRYPFDGSPNILLGYAQHPDWAGAPPCYYPTPWTSLYHTAEDWGRPAGTMAVAVASGVVSWYNPNYNYNPGRAVVVQHTLPDNSIVYSMYGHIYDVQVSAGQTIQKGDPVGRVWDQGSNSHLHWEIRYFADGSNLCSNPNAHPGVPGPGYTADHPDNHGYTAPSPFVASHQTIPPDLRQAGDIWFVPNPPFLPDTLVQIKVPVKNYGGQTAN